MFCLIFKLRINFLKQRETQSRNGCVDYLDREGQRHLDSESLKNYEDRTISSLGPKHPRIQLRDSQTLGGSEVGSERSCGSNHTQPNRCQSRQTMSGASYTQSLSILMFFWTVAIPIEAKKTFSNLFNKVRIILIPNHYTK